MINALTPGEGAAHTPTPQLELILQLVRTQALITRRLDLAMSNYHGLSFNDFLLLHHLNQGPGGRLRRVDLAARHGLTASGITRTLLPLEKLHLVERQQEPRDARVTYAAITDAGRELLGNAYVLAEQMSSTLLGNSSPNDVRSLSQALTLIAGMSAVNA